MRIEDEDYTWHSTAMCMPCGSNRPTTVVVEGHHTYRECDACKARVLLGRELDLDDRYGD